MARKKALQPHEWRPQFLAAIAQGKSVAAACREVGVDRATPYAAAKSNAEFGALWQEAEGAANDALRDEIWRRAVEGVKRPLFHAGKPVVDAEGKQVFETNYDTTLTIFEAKARMPKLYRDNMAVEHTGAVQHAHTVTLLDGRQPVEVDGSARRAAARKLIEAASDNGGGDPGDVG